MATLAQNMQEIRVDWLVNDAPAVIADLVKVSTILPDAVIRPSTHGNITEYKRFNTLPSVTWRQFEGGIVPVSFDKDMEKLALLEVGMLMEIDAGKADAYNGGVEAWFNNNVPAVLAGMGQDVSKQMWYGTTGFGSASGFLGLHQYAKVNSKVIAQKSGSSGSRCSLFAVRHEADTGVSLRVLPNANGQLISTVDYGRYMAVVDTTTGSKKPVYGRHVKAYFVMQVPSATSVAVITQIDSSHYPTAPEIDKLINAVRGAGQIVVYGNDDAIAAVSSLKYAKGVSDLGGSTAMNTVVGTWNNIPIKLDNNLVSTETTALD